LPGKHSLERQAVCRRTRVETEFAFLCGLIHDVGFAASLLALANDPHWSRSTFEELAPVLDEVHEEASGVLARLWRLPEPLQRLVDLPLAGVRLLAQGLVIGRGSGQSLLGVLVALAQLFQT
jgi:hypothetical protein